MFFFTAKLSRKRLVLLIVLAGAVVFALVYLLAGAGDAVTASGKIATNDERVGFLESYGWRVDPAPIEFSEVTIPEVFDEVYKNYNDLQQKNGFDLSKYRGRRVMQYTYRLIGYPGEADGNVVAHILVYRQKVIGGDICTLRLDGFMHGFSHKPGEKSSEGKQTSEARDGDDENESDGEETRETLDAVIPWMQK